MVNLPKNLSLRKAKIIALEHGATVERAGYGDLIFKHPDAPRFCRVNVGRKDAGPDLINFLKYITGAKMRKLQTGTKRYAVAVTVIKHPGLTSAEVSMNLPIKVSPADTSTALCAMRDAELVEYRIDRWYPTKLLFAKMPGPVPGMEEMKPVEVPPIEEIKPIPPVEEVVPKPELTQNIEFIVKTLTDSLEIVELQLNELQLITNRIRSELEVALKAREQSELLEAIKMLTAVAKKEEE